VGENAGVKRRFHLTLPQRLRDVPILHTLGDRFGVRTNLRRASIDERAAWVILEIEGDDDSLGEAVGWLAEQGVQVDRVDDEGE
jgi:hypothetical protein